MSCQSKTASAFLKQLRSSPLASSSGRSTFAPACSWVRSSSTSSLSRTPIYNLHLENNAKIVPFGGFEMPLTYGGGGQVSEHNAVRSKAGLFDVSHMVQSIFSGPTATAFLSTLTPSGISDLTYDSSAGRFSSTLSVLPNEKGGIIDDCVITRWDENKYYVVTNAARRDRDLEWIRQHLEEWNAKQAEPVKMEILDGWGLVALQGPEAASVLSLSLPPGQQDLSWLHFGRSAQLEVAGEKVHVARGGYTGEDGFEISIPPSTSVSVTQKLLESPQVSFAGLAARDSLRIEAGLCLYGNDLDETTTPSEAGLTWVIPKFRRNPDAGFIGAKAIAENIAQGPKRRRVGIEIENGPPARAGSKVFGSDGQTELGIVTSGIPSPTLQKNIAMGYLTSGHHKKGTEVKVEVRKKLREGKVVGMPFVATNYWRG